MRHIFLSLLLICGSAVAQTEFNIVTNTWPPFITQEGEESGSAQKLLEQVVAVEGDSVSWEQLNFDIAFNAVASEKKLLAFPFFKTDDRLDKALFSDPVFFTNNRIYFNRRYTLANGIEDADLSKLRFGIVSGYSYGESIDNEVHDPTVYNTETEALTALFNNDIDLLPMTEDVMEYTLDNEFPEQKLIIQSIPNLIGHASMHVVAMPNAEGQAAMDVINQHLSNYQSLGQLEVDNYAPVSRPDLVKLVTSEGHPAIVAQRTLEDSAGNYLTLPIGTQAIVLEWSDSIINRSDSPKIYRHMMDMSLVLILNGPHLGKELYVRNMHLELME